MTAPDHPHEQDRAGLAQDAVPGRDDPAGRPAHDIDPASYPVPPRGAEPHAGFEIAAQDVLGLLLDRVGLDLWVVTQVQGDAQTVLACSRPGADPGPGPAGRGVAPPSSTAAGGGSDPAVSAAAGRVEAGRVQAGRVQAGTVLSWHSSPCKLMVAGQVPQAVTRVEDVAGLRAAVRDLGLPAGAFIGVPLLGADGTLFGTLCGFGNAARPDLELALPLVHAVSRLLSTVTSREQDLVGARRESERLRVLADHDPLTGLLNRRGWDLALAVEQERIRRGGTSGAVLAVDLDGLKHLNDSAGHDAGDRALVAVAAGLRAAGRRGDPMARVGGDEFGLLAVGLTDRTEADRLADRAVRACADRGHTISVGVAIAAQGQSLVQAWQDADAAMYTARAARRHRR